MVRPANKAAVSFVLLWLQRLSTHRAQAFSSVSVDPIFFPSPMERQERMERIVPVAFRIRSTVESDVQDISEVWVRCIKDPLEERLDGNPVRFHFRRRMNFLKSKDDIQKILLSRLKAIRAGRKTMQECSLHYEEDSLAESERLRYLWLNERFRTCMERAAKLSNEPHTWNQYNFACAPQSTEYLQHKMFTAEDKCSGELVGFCEIAMLQNPVGTTCECEEMETTVQPTLVNLVVNPKFQRRGVASRMIRSAQKYVAKEWSSDSLNLYVNSDNVAAISLYRRLGFRKVANAQRLEFDKAQHYMSLPLRSGGANKRRPRSTGNDRTIADRPIPQ